MGLVVAALFFMALFVLARGIFWLLSLLAPIFLIAALFLDHKVFLQYGKWIARLLKDNLLLGMVVIVLTVIGYPLVAALLFGQAWLRWQLRPDERQKKEEDQYIEFQEVDELELKSPEKQQGTRSADYADYEELFD